MQSLLTLSKFHLELKKRIEAEENNKSSYAVWLKKTSPHFIWDKPHFRLMQVKLDNILAGKRRKIMFFTQPQIGKSSHNTIHFSARYLEKYPEHRIILGSYNDRSAARFSRQIKRIVRSRLPVPAHAKISDTVEYWETGYGKFGAMGGLRSAGVGGAIGGYPAELIVIDDPIKSSADVMSENRREVLWNWWDDVNQRAHNKTSFLFTLTRWHDDDLAGRILKSEGRVEEGGDWDVIEIRAIAEEDDVLGREVGEVVWEERFSKEFLEKIRERRPEYFECVYQQNAVAKEGSMFKTGWWRWYKDDELPELEYIVLSLDSAWETKVENDFSVITAWGVRDGKIYLLDMWRDKVIVSDLKKMAIIMYSKFSNFQPNVPVLKFLIEKKQSGIAVIQELERGNLFMRGIIEPVIPTDSKVVRAHANVGLIEAGDVYLPEQQEFTRDFVDEMTRFPRGKHDDIVDSTMQALTFIKLNTLSSYKYLCEI